MSAIALDRVRAFSLASLKRHALRSTNSLNDLRQQ